MWPASVPRPPEIEVSTEAVAAGKDIYYERCWVCHGDGAASGGIIPDLRFASEDTHARWDAIVIGGSLQQNGMPGFAPLLTIQESDAVHAFVIDRAWLAYNRQQAAPN